MVNKTMNAWRRAELCGVNKRSRNLVDWGVNFRAGKTEVITRIDRLSSCFTPAAMDATVLVAQERVSGCGLYRPSERPLSSARDNWKGADEYS